MKNILELLPEQSDCITFIGSGEDALIAADVGTGKTVIALTAAQDALRAGKVTRWLVLAPKLVATDTWAQEPSEWAHLQDLDVAIACGTPASRLKAVQSDAPVVVMNYENLPWLLDQFPRGSKKDTLPFDGLICDEIDKLKTVKSNRFKVLRNRIGVFNKRIGLTGTLIPNDPTELWGQVYMIDGGASMGRSFYKWREKYFYPIDFNQYKWKPLPDTGQHLLQALDGLCYRLPAQGLPEVCLADPEYLTLPESIRSRYRELEREYLLIVEDTAGKSRKVDAANAAVLAGKLQQITAGFSYVDGTREAVWHSRQRFDWLEKLREKLAGEQLLVFYHFIEELDELRRRYPKLQHLGNGVPTRRARDAIRRWNAGEISMLALHPSSAGHGLNLQKSGARHIAFLTLPWSGGMFRQVTGRLARRGQTARQIFVHTALCESTVDQAVFERVTQRMAGMDDFLHTLYQQQIGEQVCY